MGRAQDTTPLQLSVNTKCRRQGKGGEPGRRSTRRPGTARAPAARPPPPPAAARCRRRSPWRRRPQKRRELGDGPARGAGADRAERCRGPRRDRESPQGRAGSERGLAEQ